MEDRIYDLLEKVYTEIQDTKKEVKEINEKVDANTKAIISLENTIKPKIEALFDGHKQHTDILERIEQEVSKHEEIILRRIK